jgi:hypothetical protein
MNDFCCARLFRRNGKLDRNWVGRGAALAAPLRVLWLGAILASSCAAQTQPQTGDTAALQELQSQVHELKDMVLQLQQQTVASRAEITRLREELETRHSADNATVDEQSPAYGAPTTVQLAQRLDHVEEDQQLLSGKVDDQYQTKVESASKYRVRLSGIVLFNLFGNSGTVDNQDVPTWAEPPNPGFLRFGWRDAAAIDHRSRNFRPRDLGGAHQRQRQLRFRRRISGHLQRRE